MSVFTRLHISPLTSDLLPVVLGPSLTNVARNICFQTLSTFPENNYGFLDLPSTDAHKLISKLHGSILRGRKMKIEAARPQKRSLDRVENENSTSDHDTTKRSHKGLNVIEQDRDLVSGFEIPRGRKVKRGWTEASNEKSKSKKSRDKSKPKTKPQASSKYTDKEELLFYTRVPPNKEPMESDQKPKRNKKRKTNDASSTIVHEFEKTTIQPSFLRDSTASSKKAAHFVEAVGWVDEDGELIEKEPSSVKRSKPAKAKGLRIDLPARQHLDESPTLIEKVSATSTSASHEDVDSGFQEETSSSGTSSDTDVGSSPNDNGQPLPQIHIQPAPETPPKMHPLEALFKKPKPPLGYDSAKPSLEVQTSFSFFDSSNAEEDGEMPPMPATPFTSQDNHARNIRSAAPTPDTAHPSRFTSFASALAARGDLHPHREESEDSESSDKHASTTDKNAQKPQSEFEKRFWAERGQNNRSWKARSRASRKEQRQAENRLRRSRHGR